MIQMKKITIFEREKAKREPKPKMTPAMRREKEDARRQTNAQKKYERETRRHNNKIVKTTHLSYDVLNDWYVLDIRTGVRQDQVSPYAVHITNQRNDFFTHELEHLEYAKGETATEMCCWMEGSDKFDKALLFKPTLTNQLDLKKIAIICGIGLVALFVLAGGI